MLKLDLMPEPIAYAAIKLEAETKAFELALQRVGGQLGKLTLGFFTVHRVFRSLSEAVQAIDYSVRLLSAEFEMTREQALAFSQALDDLRIMFGFTRQETAFAAATIADAGYNAQETMYILEASMALARVSLVDLGRAAELVASTLRAFGLEASEAWRAANSLFTIMTVGRATLDDLDLGFSRLLLTARPFGVELEDLTAAYTVMTQKTTELYNVYLALMGVFRGIIRPTAALLSFIRELGYSSSIALIQHRGLIGTLRVLWDAVEQGRLSLADLTTDIRALTGLASITMEDIEEMERLFRKLEETGGELGRRATDWFKSVEAATARLRETVKSTTEDFLMSFVPMITGFLNALRDLVEGLRRISAGLADIGTGFASIPQAILTALAGVLAGRWMLSRGGRISGLVPLLIQFTIEAIFDVFPDLAARAQEGWRKTFDLILGALTAILGPIAAVSFGAKGLIITVTVSILLKIAALAFDLSRETLEEALAKVRASFRDFIEKASETALKATAKIEILPETDRVEREWKKAVANAFFAAQSAIQKGWEEQKRSIADTGKVAEDVYKRWAEIGIYVGETFAKLPLEDFQDVMRTLATELRETPRAFWEGLARGFGKTLDELKAELEEIGIKIEFVLPEAELQAAISEFESALSEAGKALQEKFLGRTDDAMTLFQDALLAGAREAGMQGLVQGLEDLTRRILLASGAAGPLPSTFSGLSKTIDQAIDLFEEFLDSNIAAILDLTPEQIKLYQDALEALKTFRDRLKAETTSVEAALKSFRGALEEARFTGLTGNLIELVRAWVNAGYSVADIQALLAQEMARAAALGPAALLAFASAVDDAASRLDEALALAARTGVSLGAGFLQTSEALAQFGKRLKESMVKLPAGPVERVSYIAEMRRKVEDQIAFIEESLRRQRAELEFQEEVLAELTAEMAHYERLGERAPIELRLQLESQEKFVEGLKENITHTENFLNRTKQFLAELSTAAKEAASALASFVSEMADVTGLPREIGNILGRATELFVLYITGETEAFNQALGAFIWNAVLDLLRLLKATDEELRAAFYRTLDDVLSMLSSLADRFSNAIATFIEELERAGQALLEFAMRLFWSSKPAQALSSAFDVIISAFTDVLFGFLWPFVAVLQRLGFVAEESTGYLEEVNRQARRLVELNIPRGFKDLAARLEYLVAKPGEPYVPEPETGIGEGPSVSWQIPAWAEAIADALGCLASSLGPLVDAIIRNLGRFAEALAPSFTELFVSVLRTFLRGLYLLSNSLVSEWAPLIIGIVESLTAFWRGQIDPFVQSNVIPFLQNVFTQLLLWLQGSFLPWLTNEFWPTLQPVLADIMSFFADEVLPTLLGEFWPQLSGLITEITSFLGSAILPFIENTLWPFLEGFVSWLLGWLGQQVLPFLENYVWPTIQRFFGKLFEWINNRLLPFIESRVIPTLEKHWPTIERFLDRLLELLDKFLTWLDENWDLVELWLDNLLRNAENQVARLFDMARISLAEESHNLFRIIGAIWSSESLTFWDKLALSIGSFFSWLGDLIGLQEGGLVTRPTVALVGEAGPEAVIPLPELKSWLGIGHGLGGGELALVNEIHLQVDGRELATVLKRVELKERILRGKI